MSLLEEIKMKRLFIKKTIVVIFTMAVIFSYTSCAGYLLDSSKNPEISTSEEIVLGEKRENPFAKSLERSADQEEVQANYVYFKIRTTNIENIEKLENLFETLNTIPLDYEIDEDKNIYNTLVNNGVEL